MIFAGCTDNDIIEETAVSNRIVAESVETTISAVLSIEENTVIESEVIPEDMEVTLENEEMTDITLDFFVLAAGIHCRYRRH